MTRCGIVLVNWNDWGDTLECLESLFRLNYPEFRVIVCDNDSSDRSLENIQLWADGRCEERPASAPALRHLTSPPTVKPIPWVELDRSRAESGGDRDIDPPLVLIRAGGNLGFAGGCNVGLRYLLARDNFGYAWILNNDTVVDPASLSCLVDEIKGNRRIGICGSTLLCYDRPKEIQALGGGYYCRWIGLPWLFGRWRHLKKHHLESRHPPRMMNYVVGASMLVSREFMEQVGLMVEDYFLFFEETDWAWRGQGRFVLGWAPRSMVYHKIGRSIGTSTNPRTKSAICDFYTLRNRLLFTRRHCRAAMPAIWLSLAGALVVRLLSGRMDLAKIIWKLLIGRAVPPVAR